MSCRARTPLQETLDVLGRSFTSALHSVKFPCDYAGKDNTVWSCFTFCTSEESAKIGMFLEFADPLSYEFMYIGTFHSLFFLTLTRVREVNQYLIYTHILYLYYNLSTEYDYCSHL